MLDRLNFDILDTTTFTRGLYSNSEIKVPDVMVASTNNFHPEGLFSTTYFGELGSPDRMARFAYIDLKQPLIHPVIYDLLVTSTALYGEIMAGIKYAKYHAKTNTFVESEYGVGKTGYSFFMQYINRVTLESTGSTSRNTAIASLRKHKKKTTTVLPVLPAGLRDYRVDQDGRPSEDEINSVYRVMLNNAAFIPSGVTAVDLLDPVRYKMQLTMQEIYDYIKSILYGKRGFINKKVIDRRVHGATRNVLTGLQQESSDIGHPTFIDDDTTVIGLYQALKATQHQTSYLVRTFLLPIFPSEGIPFQMVDKNMKRVSVPYDTKTYRSMQTYAGVNKLVDSLASGIHDTVMKYGDHYYGLIYDSVDEYMVLHDIEDLPEQLDASNVRFLTAVDILYLACADELDKSVGTVTRYPVLEHGSIYATKYVVKTTIASVIKHELSPDGIRTGSSKIRWPMLKSGLFRTISVPGSRLDSMGADFDGDTVSVIIAWDKESIAEINEVLQSTEYWLEAEGGLLYSGSNKYNEMAMKVLTAT